MFVRPISTSVSFKMYRMCNNFSASRKKRRPSHNSSVLPPVWSCLPSLALPDGAHHHDKDSSFFLLPSKDSNQCLFAVSCYRQIEAKKLKVKHEDVTRDTVQK